jgi:intracellular sulfur oxidation DsrE/DsrF family protein
LTENYFSVIVKENGVGISRQQFLTAAALGGSVAPLTSRVLGAETPAPEAAMHAHFHIMKPSEFNHAKLQSTLQNSKPHKQVFQASNSVVLAPGIASIYIHMQNSMNAHEFSFGFGPGSLATLGVLMGPAIVLALDDAMWSKYAFGTAFKLAPTNAYYKATSDLRANVSPDDPGGLYQDWSAQAVMHRGGAFAVCHNAMTFVASIFGSKMGVAPASVLSDFEQHVLPGFQVVPAGVAVVQLAQQHGWTLFAIA